MNEQQLRRLSDCEKQVSKNGEMLRDYLAQVVNFTKNTVSQHSFVESLDNLNTVQTYEIGALKQQLADYFLSQKDSNAKIEDLREFAKNTQVLSTIHKESFKAHQGALDESKVKHAHHTEKIARIEDKLPEIGKLALALQDLQKNLQLLNASSIAQKDLLNVEINRSDAKHQLQAANNSIVQAQIDDHKVKMDERSKAWQQTIFDLQAQFKQSLGDLSQVIHVKMDNLPKPESIVLPDFEKMLADQQEDTLSKVSLKARKIDAALEQAQANEIKMTIMDKKLEKILDILANNDFK